MASDSKRQTRKQPFRRSRNGSVRRLNRTRFWMNPVRLKSSIKIIMTARRRVDDVVIAKRSGYKKYIYVSDTKRTRIRVRVWNLMLSERMKPLMMISAIDGASGLRFSWNVWIFLPFLFSFANRYWLVLRLWNFENWIKNTWRSTHRNYYFWFCQYLKLKFSKHVLFSWNFLWIKFSYLIIWTYCKYILLKFVVHINYIIILWHREKNIKNSIAKMRKDYYDVETL